jgi:hypothetical protein
MPVTENTKAYIKYNKYCMLVIVELLYGTQGKKERKREC